MVSYFYERALKAIKDVLGDMNISREEVKRNLRALKDEIDVLIESL